MDVRMPGVDGIEATRRIVADPRGGPRVIVLTTFELDEYVYEALRAGASGFLLKDAAARRLVQAIRERGRRRGAARPAVTRRLIEELRPPARTRRAGAAAARPDRPGDRGAAADRPRPVQRRDRRATCSSARRP